VKELLVKRSITVDHVTIYRWVQRFTPEFVEAARPCRRAPGDRSFVDETYLKVAGGAYRATWAPAARQNRRTTASFSIHPERMPSIRRRSQNRDANASPV
jgi:transposase-like protein